MSGLLEREINLWSPMKPGQPYLAQIAGLGFSFYAPTAMAAKRAAETWRQAEHLKMTLGPKKAAAQIAQKEGAA